MVKFREASPGAAYEIAVGVTDAEEASKLGLAVVECTAGGVPSAYGRYKDAPDGGPLGITVDKPGDTQVIAGGTAAPATSDSAGDKGQFINQDDPFVHGNPDGSSVHKDGAAPGKLLEDQDNSAEIAAAKNAKK